MSGVEFLPEAGGDEPPAEPDPTARPRPRFGRAARIAVVVVAAAGLAGWVATRPSDPVPHPQAAATAPRPSTPSPPRSAAPSWTIRHTGLVECSFGAPVRPDVVRAMRRYLKGISIDRVLSSRCVTGSADHPKIVSESVVGRYGKIAVEVALSRRDADFPPSYQVVPVTARTVMLGGVETESAGIKLRISSTGDGHTMPPRFHIQQLADYLSLNTVL